MWNKAEMFLSKDKYIAPLIKKYGHCTIKPRKKTNYFEDLVDAIVQQQLSMKAASSIFGRIKDKVGKNKLSSKGLKHKWRSTSIKSVLITPEKVMGLTDADLRECGLSRGKISYIRDLAEKVINKKLEIKKLDKMTDDEIIKELITVKGIGEWTVHMFLMFTLGRQDVFPVGDLGLRNSFEKTIKKRLNTKEMEKFALRWKPYRTVASWYIWKSLENVKSGEAA